VQYFICLTRVLSVMVISIDLLTIGFCSLHVAWFAKPGVASSLSRANLSYLHPESHLGRQSHRIAGQSLEATPSYYTTRTLDAP
jgi:hypothetical protein